MCKKYRHDRTWTRTLSVGKSQEANGLFFLIFVFFLCEINPENKENFLKMMKEKQTDWKQSIVINGFGMVNIFPKKQLMTSLSKERATHLGWSLLLEVAAQHKDI